MSCEPGVPVACDAPIPGIELDIDGEVEAKWQGVIVAISEWLLADDRLQAKIVAYASAEGSESESELRSNRLADAVVEALVELGMPADRLSAEGRGESDPLASNRLEYGRSMNQRIVVECRREAGW